MEWSMGANLAVPQTLLQLAAGRTSLTIWNDGHAVIKTGSHLRELGALEGRFALRFVYDRQADQRLSEDLLIELASCLDFSRKCQRSDCGVAITVERQLSALRHFVTAKWCSKKCAATEAGRRYRERNRRSITTDPHKGCERNDCYKAISAEKQSNGLIRGTPAKWCSRQCAMVVANRRARNRRARR